MPEMSVVTRLYKGSVCLFDVCYSWTPYGPPGLKHGEDVKWVKTNSAGSPCDNGHYRGLSYHWMRGPDGNTYTAVTMKVEEVTDCP